jgi:hypothetical protein
LSNATFNLVSKDKNQGVLLRDWINKTPKRRVVPNPETGSETTDRWNSCYQQFLALGGRRKTSSLSVKQKLGETLAVLGKA